MRLRIGVLVLASFSIGAALFMACSTFTDGTPSTPPDDAGALDSDVPIPECPDGSALCDHFERGTSPEMLTGPWDPTLFGDSRVVLYLDSSEKKTGDTSLRARDQGTGGSGALTFRVTGDIPIHIEFDLRIEKVQPLATIIMQYLLDDSSTAVNISLQQYGLKLSEQAAVTGDAGYIDTPALALPPAMWTHVIFTFDDNHVAKLELPELSLASQQKIVHPTTTASQVRLGLPYVVSHAATEPFDVWFDDVVITH